MVYLMHNALGQLEGIVSEQGTILVEQFPSFYGPQHPTATPYSDLSSYAQSLTWHSLSQDPTGLIWMGARYYDPRGGRFLSPDPIGHPISLNLYAYANGDPVNYMDPDGRFFSRVYDTFAPTLLNCGFATQYANKNFTNSFSYQIGHFDLPEGEIANINGIDTQPHEAMEIAFMLSRYAGGAKVHGIYNATHGKISDVAECLSGSLRFQTPPEYLLMKQWEHFHATHGRKAKLFQTCHSGGAIKVRNALWASPKAIRNRIIVLAIAPGKIVPGKLCFQSFNYASKNDWIYRFDYYGVARLQGYPDELILLDPRPDAPDFDHSFSSPTFQPVIDLRMKDYILNYGGIK